MPYIINGNDEEGYTLTHSSGTLVYTTCPCCDKPLWNRQAAQNLAANLEAVDTAMLDSLRGGERC
jgi:hypothetical protein